MKVQCRNIFTSFVNQIRIQQRIKFMTYSEESIIKINYYYNVKSTSAHMTTEIEHAQLVKKLYLILNTLKDEIQIHKAKHESQLLFLQEMVQKKDQQIAKLKQIAQKKELSLSIKQISKDRPNNIQKKIVIPIKRSARANSITQFNIESKSQQDITQHHPLIDIPITSRIEYNKQNTKHMISSCTFNDKLLQTQKIRSKQKSGVDSVDTKRYRVSSKMDNKQNPPKMDELKFNGYKSPTQSSRSKSKLSIKKNAVVLKENEQAYFSMQQHKIDKGAQQNNISYKKLINVFIPNKSNKTLRLKGSIQFKQGHQLRHY